MTEAISSTGAKTRWKITACDTGNELCAQRVSQPHARKLARELDAARGNKVQTQRLHGILKVYWRETAEALGRGERTLARLTRNRHVAGCRTIPKAA